MFLRDWDTRLSGLLTHPYFNEAVRHDHEIKELTKEISQEIKEIKVNNVFMSPAYEKTGEKLDNLFKKFEELGWEKIRTK